MTEPSTLQMVASKALGGAERWFIRFSTALAAHGAPAQLAIRQGGALDGLDLGGLPVHRLPYRTTWDPWSRRAVGRLIEHLRPDIVQTYMGRATRLARLPSASTTSTTSLTQHGRSRPISSPRAAPRMVCRMMPGCWSRSDGSCRSRDSAI